MRKLKFIPALFLVASLTLAFTSVLQSYKIGAKHDVKFDSKDASGIFSELSGDIEFDANDLSKSKFDLKIGVASINTGNALQNRHAKSDKWFDAEKYPNIVFTSNKVEKTDQGYKTTGILEIRGVKKNATIPFTFKNNAFNAKFSVDRNDFNIGKPTADVSNIMKIDATIPVSKK
jgi:polyisoprenoid-binding protein YceI